MGAFCKPLQKAQSLPLDVQIGTRQIHQFRQENHQLITVSRENVGTLLLGNKNYDFQVFCGSTAEIVSSASPFIPEQVLG
jgi:hypothetical protein